MGLIRIYDPLVSDVNKELIPKAEELMSQVQGQSQTLGFQSQGQGQLVIQGLEHDSWP